jgi:hypothetical protein
MTHYPELILVVLETFMHMDLVLDMDCTVVYTYKRSQNPSQLKVHEPKMYKSRGPAQAVHIHVFIKTVDSFLATRSKPICGKCSKPFSLIFYRETHVHSSTNKRERERERELQAGQVFPDPLRQAEGLQAHQVPPWEQFAGQPVLQTSKPQRPSLFL